MDKLLTRMKSAGTLTLYKPEEAAPCKSNTQGMVSHLNAFVQKSLQTTPLPTTVVTQHPFGVSAKARLHCSDPLS